MTEKPVSEMTLAELLAHASSVDAKTRQDREGLALQKMGAAPRRPAGESKWTEAEIAETAARAKAEEERRRAGPQVPSHLAGIRATDMSPQQHDEACKALGLPRVSTMELIGQQAAWERTHGHG